MPLWIGQEIQEVLWPELKGGAYAQAQFAWLAGMAVMGR
jgi:hypothetical protein